MEKILKFYTDNESWINLIKDIVYFFGAFTLIKFLWNWNFVRKTEKIEANLRFRERIEADLQDHVTLDQFRGRGLGKSLAEGCIAHAAEHGGTVVWCKARQSAVGFYRSLGFGEQGNPFLLPKYNNELYFIMQRPLFSEKTDTPR